MSDGIDPLEIAVIAAVILVVLYWVVWLPARERRKRDQERMRAGKRGPGVGQAWDPDLTKGRRNQ